MYYLFFGIVYIFSLLPFWLLYGISDVVRWIIFGIIGYRKKVIHDNIVNSFPELSSSAHRRIISEFEQSFCDQWIELIKLLTINPKQLQKRVQCDWSLFHQYHQEHISCTALLAHQFNWEYANIACKLNIEQTFAGMYLPLKSKLVNRLILHIRGRMQTVMIDASNLKTSLPLLKGNTYVLGLLADQTPANMNAARWYHFLHRPCPFLTGPEKQARMARTAVVFCETRKLKRGHYEVILTEICKDARKMEENVILDTYVSMLQQSIQSNPSGWLWSHKRWKRKPQMEDEIHPISM